MRKPVDGVVAAQARRGPRPWRDRGRSPPRPRAARRPRSRRRRARSARREADLPGMVAQMRRCAGSAADAARRPRSTSPISTAAGVALAALGAGTASRPVVAGSQRAPAAGRRAGDRRIAARVSTGAARRALALRRHGSSSAKKRPSLHTPKQAPARRRAAPRRARPARSRPRARAAPRARRGPRHRAPARIRPPTPAGRRRRSGCSRPDRHPLVEIGAQPQLLPRPPARSAASSTATNGASSTSIRPRSTGVTSQ